ncbi:UNVERIFIED_CONTAM: hypothetical protein Slati_1856100 [Sesamum latifolium]|uniref:Uncharacterized protein n=1 Tax=Sesamum latifolium TaxID=2727402 RepID=A0AAW2WZC6_9LAMI
MSSSNSLSSSASTSGSSATSPHPMNVPAPPLGPPRVTVHPPSRHSPSEENPTQAKFQDMLLREPWSGPWKEKFIFIQPPPNQEWPFRIDWSPDKPEPITEGGGLKGDQINHLTSSWYKPRKLLEEEVLCLAGLSPAPLRVRGTLGSLVAFARLGMLSLESSQPLPPRGLKVRVLPPPSPVVVTKPVLATRKNASGSTSPRAGVLIRPNPPGPASIVNQERRGDKPRKVQLVLRKRNNLKLLKEITAWWKEAREELRSSDHEAVEAEGEKIVPDWNITNQSCVFLHGAGHDSWELYNNYCLPRDQATILTTPHTRLEENHAHVLMQAAAFNRALSLKCTGFRRRHIMADRKVRDLQRRLAEASGKGVELEAQKALLESRVKELEDQVARFASEVVQAKEEAFRRGREEGFSAGEAAGLG